MVPMEDDNRRAAGERLIAYAFVGLMVGLLVVMGHNVRRANLAVADVQSALALERSAHERSEALVDQLTTETNLLMVERRKLMNQIEFLAAQPAPERLVLQRCEDRPTPAFPRESQFPALP